MPNRPGEADTQLAPDLAGPKFPLRGAESQVRLVELFAVATGAVLLIGLFSLRLDPWSVKPDWNQPIDFHNYLWMAERFAQADAAAFLYP